MDISYNRLKCYLPEAGELTPDELSRILTAIGLEVSAVKAIEPIRGGLKGLVVGEVLTCEAHPNSDHLHITTVNVGEGDPLPIVCGAPNVAAGQKVIVATIGTTLYHGDEAYTIKKGKLRVLFLIGDDPHRIKGERNAPFIKQIIDAFVHIPVERPVIAIFAPSPEHYVYARATHFAQYNQRFGRIEHAFIRLNQFVERGAYQIDIGIVLYPHIPLATAQLHFASVGYGCRHQHRVGNIYLGIIHCFKRSKEDGYRIHFALAFL